MRRVRPLPLLLAAGLALTPAPPGATRVALGPGAGLVFGDSATGVVLWAARPGQPGRGPTPDFVGWFVPDSVLRWLGRGGLLLRGPAPVQGEAVETDPLVAADGGFVTLARLAVPEDPARPLLLTFGHETQRERWAVPVTAGEVRGLFTALTAWARASAFHPPADLGYANPTHLAATPDRDPAAPAPAVPAGLRLRGVHEVWLSGELDGAGRVMPGTVRVLWSDWTALARAAAEVFEEYRYTRRDGPGGAARLRIYQRFRFRGEE